MSDCGCHHEAQNARERRVLRIALALNITLETVKWNVKNILAKLGVSSRYDAIAWARKHGIGNQLRA